MKIFITVLALICISSAVLSQNVNESWFKEYRTVISGSHYEAGWLHELFFGSHWRDVWITPVRVGVVDLAKYGGGLTPSEKGGGLQTKSLKFKGVDGKEYKFRSLDKDPKKTLPVELQESVAKDIVQDQISSSNPYAGFVVNPILDAVGVYHSDYSLVILPDDPALGEFRKDFGGLQGIMEIVPETEQFEGSDKVISTVKLLDRLNKEFDESVDGKEFLKARLLDIFFGDWDRHKDQWKWIRFDEGDKKLYKPLPMDRDQAFAEFDGFLPWIASQNVPQLNHFGFSYPDMRFMTWSGRYLDQRFLTFINKADWDNVTNDVYSKLTNEVLENAVKKLPPEVYKICKDEITEKLKSRRDQLKEASAEYYELVNSVVDIYTTDKDDYVEINAEQALIPVTQDYSNTYISIFKRDKITGEKTGDVIRSKMFDSRLNSEIRIYLQDGDDAAVIKDFGSLPDLKIIGGEGKDEIVNKSEQAVYFYDDGKKSKITGDVSWNKSKYKYAYEKPLKKFKEEKKELSKEEKKKYEEEIGNLRYDPVAPPDKFDFNSFIPIFYYSPDIGPFFGGSFNYLKYGFRMHPYLYKLQFTLGYAPDKKGIRGLLADFNSDFRGIVKNSGINIHLRKSGIEVNNYFGMGNNSVYNDSLFKAKYYKVENEKYSGDIGITFPVDKKLRFNLGAGFFHFRVESKNYTITNSLGFIFNNSKKVNIVFVKGGIELDGRDHFSAPYKGYYFNISGNYSPDLFSNNYEFGRITGDLRSYIGYKTAVSLALRAWGEKVIGNYYPFFESAFLGGSKTLRGYPSERFAGDGSLMGTAELRLNLFSYNFLFPQAMGIFGFAETGRVFMKEEKSKKWHASFGGGIFMHFINRDFTFKLTYARSDEKDYVLYFGTGFGF